MADDCIRIQRNMSTGNVILAVAVLLISVTSYIQNGELKEMEKRLNKIEQTMEIKND